MAKDDGPIDCLDTALPGLLVALSVLRMTDGLVTLVDDVNLKGASFLVRKAFLVWGEVVSGLLHQTGYSQWCLHLSGFWQPLKLYYTCLKLAFCQLRPGGGGGGGLCSKPVPERLEWPCLLQISQVVRLKM